MRLHRPSEMRVQIESGQRMKNAAATADAFISTVSAQQDPDGRNRKPCHGPADSPSYRWPQRFLVKDSRAPASPPHAPASTGVDRHSGSAIWPRSAQTPHPRRPVLTEVRPPRGRRLPGACGQPPRGHCSDRSSCGLEARHPHRRGPPPSRPSRRPRRRRALAIAQGALTPQGVGRRYRMSGPLSRLSVRCLHCRPAVISTLPMGGAILPPPAKTRFRRATV